MNREIKFRVRYKNNWCIIELNKGLTEFGYEAYMECVKNGERFYEYTGLKDKQGKEVWEGDIVKRIYDFTKLGKPKEAIQQIIFDNGKYKFFREYKDGSRGYSDCYSGHKIYPWEVIGNIYEDGHLLNPGLIKD